MTDEIGNALTRIFTQIHVINLRSRKDRRRQMQSELKRIGIDFDGPFVHLQEAFSFGDGGPFPSAGARGCFMSHLEVLKKSAVIGPGHVLILEDDVDFTVHCAKHLPEAVDALVARPWAIFYGGHDMVRDPGIRPISIVEPDAWILGTHFVGFNQSVIPDVIKYLEAALLQLECHPAGGPRGIDSAYRRFRAANPALDTFLAWPRLGVQRPSRSDISPKFWLDKVPIARKISQVVRRLRRRAAC